MCSPPEELSQNGLTRTTKLVAVNAEEEGGGGGGGKSKTSVIFVPEMHYRGRKLCMKASDGGELKHDWINQLVEYTFTTTTTTTFNNNKRKVLTVSAA